jgi:hypothetical protein
MTRAQDIDALAGAIRRLIEALIAGDQRAIGSHQNLTDAQAGLRDALRGVFAVRTEATND